MEECHKETSAYLQTQIHIYKRELHSSPEQLGGFDLLEEALESILQMTQDLRSVNFFNLTRNHFQNLAYFGLLNFTHYSAHFLNSANLQNLSYFQNSTD
jgi:hypothetical protein